MSYPFGPQWPTYRQFWAAIKAKHPGASLCTLPSTVLKDQDGVALPPCYVFVKGKAPIGFFRPSNVDDEMLWHHLRTYAVHFDIGPEVFGLTIGWPGVPTAEQWLGEDGNAQTSGDAPAQE